MEKQLKPQLACDADLSKARFPMMFFPKLDGVRGLHITGSMTGRSLKPHANLHVTKKYSFCRCEGFDGEFTYGDIRGDSLCRDTTSVMSSIKGEPDVYWNLFDYLRDDLLDKTYKQRYDELVVFAAKHSEWFRSMNIRVIPYAWIHSIEEAEEFYQDCLDKGYEGAVGRDADELHKSGRATVKSNSYIRLKPSSDKEARCIRLVEAMENQNEAKTNELGRTERSSHKENKVGKGMVGMLVCIDVVSGMEIDVGAGRMTHEERTYYWNNPEEMIGEFIKYKSMDVGIKTKPRFARYICKRSIEDMSE